MIKKHLLLFLLGSIFLYAGNCYSFTFSVTPTSETCKGNGELSFTVNNANANGSILFYIYKLPDNVVPLITTSATSVKGLASGDYLVIAKETVGNTVTSQQQNVTIDKKIVSLTYVVKVLNQACSTTSDILVSTLTGTPATYEIISGPILFPIQNSNSFSGLPQGVYKAKVIDVCGNSVVQNFTITLNTTNITITPPVFSELTPLDCSKIMVSQTMTPAPGTVIGYPINIVYTLNLPGSPPPTIINKTVASGDPLSQEVTEIFPNFTNQTYSYSIAITDACGKTYPVSNFQVNPQIDLKGAILNLDCDRYGIKLTASNFASPYNLNFNSAPAGFNPSAYNSTYPGPYNTADVLFGSVGNFVPFGDYTVSITDACNRVFATTLSVVTKPPQIDAKSWNNGCLTNSGTIQIKIPNYIIVTATITEAPSTYPFTLPHDVSSIIDANGILLLDPMPLGDYTIFLEDNCNDVLPPVKINIPVWEDLGVSINSRPGCELNKTSLKVASLNGKLTSVKITSAPPGYGIPLPHDVSENITSSGNFYLNNLIGGDYIFSTIDECNFSTDTAVTIEGYNITKNAFALLPNCGSYDIELEYICNGNTNEFFWLQKQLPSGAWGNPETNIEYQEGSVPNAINSLPMINQSKNYNLTYNGLLRIVHNFQSYNNGKDLKDGIVSSSDRDCIEYLSPVLAFNQALEIVDVYRMACTISGNLDVVIVANGTPPLQYSIIDAAGTKIFDNGTSNIFTSLSVGTYRFQVEDSCGNSVNSSFDVSTLESLAKIYPTCDLTQCVNNITGNETFDLTSLNNTILGDQKPSLYTLNYFKNISDAQNNTNPITNPSQFNPISNPQTLYVRLHYNALPYCYETATINVLIAKNPALNLNSSYLRCDANPVTLNASIGNPPTTTYLWSNGDTTPIQTITKIGETNLTITAENLYGFCDTQPLACVSTKDIRVVLSEYPSIDRIEIEDWSEYDNSITIYSANPSSFIYSIDGINFQSQNTFTGLKKGFYTVYVKDLNSCNTVEQKVALLNYPRFFTPNGDGYHETWFVQNSDFEPDFMVEIYSRYGKLLTTFSSKSEGWDGTYNGRMMPSDDYWFLVHRQDGTIYKGHFALKR